MNFKEWIPKEKANILFVAVLSVLFVSMLSMPINALTNYLTPKRIITIRVEGMGNPKGEALICNEIMNNERQENYFSVIKAGEYSGAWEYRDMEAYGYTCDVIALKSGTTGSEVSFIASIDVGNYICFNKVPWGPMVSILVGDEEHQIDLYSEDGGQLKFYPFSQNMLPIVMKIVIYCIVYLVTFACILLLRKGWKWVRRTLNFLTKQVKTQDIFLAWIGLYIFAVFQYKVGIPNYLGFGDQVYYWGSFLTEPDKWNPVVFAAETMSFRGYLCNVIPIVAQVVGRAAHADPVLVYLIFTSFAIAWLTVYVIPQLYELLTGRKAMLGQMIAFLAVYLFFWNGTLTAILVDMFGAVSFLSGMLFALKFWRKTSTWSGVCAGLFWGSACNYRTAYQYGILVILLAAISRHFLIRAKKRGEKTFAEKESVRYKNVISGVLLSLLAFFVVSIPQAQINHVRGHNGILPYDYVGAWTVEGSPRETSLLECSANGSLTTGYTGYPYVVSDDQMLTMKTQIYDQGELLTIAQILDVYANSPLEALIYIAKKLVLAFDVKTNVTYPEGVDWRKTHGLLFSFLNYAVLLVAAHTVLFHKKVHKIEQVLFTCFFAGLVLPQMFVHVEWRYFLATYILLYYFFSYHFVGEQLMYAEKDDRMLDRNSMFRMLAYIFAAFVVSLTIYA